MQYSLTFEPLLPWWLLGLLAFVIISLLGLMMRRLARRPWLRALMGLVLLGALANPVFLQEDREAVKTIVALVIDESASQSLQNRTAQTEVAAAQIEERLNASGLFDVRRVVVRSEDLKRRDQTAVARAISTAIQDVPQSRFGGAVLITDGQVHDAEALPQVLANAPIHSLITGQEGEVDQRVRFINPQPFGIVGQNIELTVQVDWDGIALTGDDFAEITIRLDDEELIFESVPVGEPVPLDIVLEKAGQSIVEVELMPLEGELTALNNRAIATIDGVRENLRVLLVSGEPHAGERTWRNLLKSDASVDLVHFTILRPPEKQDGTPINELALIAFPTRELFVEKIDDFDLIIFDRYQYRNVLPFLYYDYIAQYVENGGALLIAAGPEFSGERSIANTPLVSALPGVPNGVVTEAPFYPRISETGQRHPVTRDLDGGATEPPSWSRWFRIIGAQNIEGQVVMEGGNAEPLLILNRNGAGRVGMFLSDHGWLWARGFEGGGPHVALYRRIAHWLMKQPELEEERLIGVSAGSALTIRRQTMQETLPPAIITLPDGSRQEVLLTEARPGIFEATLYDMPTGLYALEQDELSVLAHVGPVDAPEFEQMVSTMTVMQTALRAARASVQRLNLAGDNAPLIVPLDAGRPIEGRGWIGLHRSGETVLKSIDRYALLNGPLALLLLLSLAGMMWYRESR